MAESLTYVKPKMVSTMSIRPSLLSIHYVGVGHHQIFLAFTLVRDPTNLEQLYTILKCPSLSLPYLYSLDDSSSNLRICSMSLPNLMLVHH